MLVPLDDLRVHDIDVGFAAALEAAQETVAVDEVVGTGDPEGHGGRGRVIPCVAFGLCPVVIVEIRVVGVWRGRGGGRGRTGRGRIGVWLWASSMIEALPLVYARVFRQMRVGVSVGKVLSHAAVAVLLFVFPVFDLFLCSRGEDAFLSGEAFAAEPPAHALRADVHRRELEVPVAKVLLSPLVSPVEEEAEDEVAHGAVEAAR